MTPKEAALAANHNLECHALKLPSTGEIYGYVVVDRRDRRKTVAGGATPAQAWQDVAPQRNEDRP